MKKKRNIEEGGGPNWLDTYADMVTLLLTFFVLLFSISTVNAEKWSILVKALSSNSSQANQIVINADKNKESSDDKLVPPAEDNKALLVDDSKENIVPENPESITDFDQLYFYLKKYVEDNNLESDVELFKGEGFTFVTFRNNIFFDGDSSVLRTQSKTILDIFSRALKPINKQISAIRCSGHTARARSATTPNIDWQDWELSALRAAHVVSYISQKNVVDGHKLSSAGYGEHNPIVPHDGTEATRIKNRRVEIYIAQEGAKELTLNEIYDEIDKKVKDKANNPSGQTKASSNSASSAAKATEKATVAKESAKAEDKNKATTN